VALTADHGVAPVPGGGRAHFGIRDAGRLRAGGGLFVDAAEPAAIACGFRPGQKRQRDRSTPISYFQPTIFPTVYVRKPAVLESVRRAIMSLPRARAESLYHR
jgi:hypothetical protein